jgi:hypothetical protein
MFFSYCATPRDLVTRGYCERCRSCCVVCSAWLHRCGRYRHGWLETPHRAGKAPASRVIQRTGLNLAVDDVSTILHGQFDSVVCTGRLGAFDGWRIAFGRCTVGRYGVYLNDRGKPLGTFCKRIAMRRENLLRISAQCMAAIFDGMDGHNALAGHTALTVVEIC